MTLTTFVYHNNVHIAAAPYCHLKATGAAPVVHYMDGPLDYCHRHMVLDMSGMTAGGRVSAEDVGRQWDAELQVDDATRTVHFGAIVFELPVMIWTADMWGNMGHPHRNLSFAGYRTDVLGMTSGFFARDLAKFVEVMFGPEWTLTMETEDKLPSRDRDLFADTYGPYDGLPADRSVGYFDQFVRLYAM